MQSRVISEADGWGKARSSLMQRGTLRASGILTKEDEIENGKIQEPGELQIKRTPQGGSSLLAESVQDPMIYPGLYAPSGFDMMGILVGLPPFLCYVLQILLG